MGNSTASVSGASEAQVPRDGGYSVEFVDHAIVGGTVTYCFQVLPPTGCSHIGQTFNRTYEEFRDLHDVMSARHFAKAPELPLSTFFEHTDLNFISERAVALERYIQRVLALEPHPKTRALRRFLGLWEPSPAAAPCFDCDGYLLIHRHRLPVGIIAVALSFCPPAWMLRTCSLACKALCAASRHTRCWSALQACLPQAERQLEGWLALLIPTCVGLQALSLDIAFANPKLATALPGGICLPQLRRLALRLRDATATDIAVELLESVESPCLQKISVEALVVTPVLLQELCRVVLATEGKLAALKLICTPGARPLHLDERVSLALNQLLASAPGLEDLTVGVPQWASGAGVERVLSPLTPPDVEVPYSQPILADLAGLSQLQVLTFDFLSDDVLLCLRSVADGSLNLRRASFSGVKRHVAAPDEVLVTLLSKIGDGLEEFSILIDVERELRPFMQGFLRTRIGALPNIWNRRMALRSLFLNWTAFDDDGVRCITEHCPNLHTLLLDRSEYWTDAVAAEVANNLPQLQHFRMRASAMLSDRSLYSLGDAAHRFVTLEIEPSYMMTQLGLDILKQKLCPNNGGLADVSDYLDPGVYSVSLMAALAGEPDPHAPPPGGVNDGYLQRRSSNCTLRILNPEGQEATNTEMSGGFITDFRMW